MAPEAFTFVATTPLDATALAAALGGRVSRTERVTRRWYDTFDWDLWAHGLVLEADERPSGVHRVALRSAADHRENWVQEVGSVPSSRDQFPAGPWKRTIGPLIGLRALIPVARAPVETTEISVTDRRDKCVAVALVDATTPPHGDATTWVRVVSIRGYDDDSAALAERVASVDGVARAGMHPLAATTVDGRRPGTSGTEVRVQLDPETAAVHALATMLRNFLSVMSSLEPWLVDSPDTEFLHDWRVALRRSRSVLKLAEGIVPARDLDVWRPRLRDLQQRSGELRDLDVFALEYESYLSLVPEELVEDLEPLRELLTRRRTAARAEFERYIGSAEHEQLRAGHSVFLDRLAHTSPVHESDSGAPDASRPIREAGAARIRRAHRRLLRRGRRVGADSPPADLHRARIATKEFRYAIELHASLLERDAVKALIGRLKSLQDLLGGFQDAEAHAEAMHLLAEYLVASGDAPARSIMAIGLLSQAFTDQNADVRARVAQEFGCFDDDATVALLDRAIGAKASA